MKPFTLTSPNNPRVKQARALRRRKEREETGLFLVEGIRHVGDAVQSGAPIEYIVYAPDQLTSDFALTLLREQEQRGVPCLAVANEVFETLAEKENPAGIVAVARRPQASLADLAPHTHPWLVALISPADPGNIGTILRSMDAVGAQALVLLDNSADPFHPSVVRASMGALFWLPVIQAGFADFSAWARTAGYHLVGTSAHGSLDYRSLPVYPMPLALLLGSERAGLSPEQTAACETLVRLPMRGRATSLNLAVAAGVLLYDILAKSTAAP